MSEKQAEYLTEMNCLYSLLFTLTILADIQYVYTLLPFFYIYIYMYGHMGLKF